MTRARIITERAILEACQLLLARRGRRPTTLVLHPADWVGLRTRLARSSNALTIGDDRIQIGPFDLAITVDAECERHHFGLLFAATNGSPRPAPPGDGTR
jgi:hypothetical protein